MTVAMALPPQTPTLPGWPFVGLLPAVRRDTVGTFESAAKLGDVVRLAFPFHPAFSLNHPDAVKHVLVDNHRNYGKETRGYRTLSIGLGQGLVTSDGDFWRKQRRIAQPAFHHRRIVRFIDTMDVSVRHMVERWQEASPKGGTLEVDEEMMRVTLEIVGLCLMSTDLSDATDSVSEAMSLMLKETVWRVMHPLAPPLSVPTRRNRRLLNALSNLNELVQSIIESRRKAEDMGHDLLAMLMEARDEETGEGMTDKQLRDEVFTMVSAGHETTANALTWTLHLLAENPEVRERLHEELDEVLDGDAPITLETLGRLTYTEAVLKESMRLRPPVWLFARSVTEDDEIMGHRIPSGSMVFVPSYVLHRDPRFWDDPARFEPERFLGDKGKAISKYVYFPFAGGPRVCIGQAFAMMEGKILLARIAQRAHLSSVPGREVVTQPTITLRPRDGLPMDLSWRTNGVDRPSPC